jgi:hypothetical protein
MLDASDIGWVVTQPTRLRYSQNSLIEMRRETIVRDKSAIEAIRSSAALVVSVARDQLGHGLAYDEKAVHWLDGYIQRQHENGEPRVRDALVNTLGSFLGECVIHSFGGEWALVDGTWSVRFDETNAVFPFAKAVKHLENGSEDSVLSFFTLIPILYRVTRGHD